MRKRIAALVGLASAAVVTFAPAASADTVEQFTVPLSGDQVVPAAGDPDGTGGVFMSLGRHSGTLCFFADTANISTPLTGVTLNRGVSGQTGATVLTLYGASNDPDVSGCQTIGRELTRELQRHGSDYYLDFRNEEYPGGVLRGQLR